MLNDIVSIGKGAESPAEQSLVWSVQAVAREIALLHRLSSTIQRASMASKHLNVPKSYRIRGEDGVDAEPLLQEVYANFIGGQFPTITDCLRQRLSDSMALRRRRITYKRTFCRVSPLWSNKTAEIELFESRHRDAAIPGPADNAWEKNDDPFKRFSKQFSSAWATEGVDNHRKASARFVKSATKTAAPGNHEKLVFPVAPTVPDYQRYKLLRRRREEARATRFRSFPDIAQYGDDSKIRSCDGQVPPDSTFTELNNIKLKADTRPQADSEIDLIDCLERNGEVICPFYLHALPSLYISDEKQWKYVTTLLAGCLNHAPGACLQNLLRSHVINDLDAYFCLFDDCDQPGELFSHRSDWLHHMGQHSMRWRCKAKSHGLCIFFDADEY